MADESIHPDDPAARARGAAASEGHANALLARLRAWLARLRQPRQAVRALVTALVILVILAIVIDAAVIFLAYRGVSADVRALDQLSQRDHSSLSTADVATARDRLVDLDTNLGRLRAATGIPLGDTLLPHLPWLGPRYQAARGILRYGRLLAGAGASAAGIGQQALHALDVTGASASVAPTSPTWLDVLSTRQTELERDAAEIEQAKSLRAHIDVSYLPNSLQTKLARVDHELARANAVQLVHDDLPAALIALGERGPQRYMVLFQNPAELRPSGGFPGTGALVTVDRGQLVDYTFFDIHTLTDDYIQQRPAKLPQPYPIAHFFPQDGFLLHDSTWWADFPRSGKQFMSMYAVTDWPKINGIIAVEPTVVSDLLNVTGPVTVEVDGQERHVDAANVYEEIERPRMLRREGVIAGPEDDLHKEVLSLIGKQMIDKLKKADRSQMVKATKALIGAADVRDIQLYSPNSTVESALDARHWTGRIVPNPSIPTLAITYGNLVTDKASSYMHPTTTVTFDAPKNGRQQVTLQLDLTHTGSNSADPFYQGFQHWWIEVHLPPGSTVVSRSQALQPDPDAPNGGTYLVPLFPGQHYRVRVVFTMPASQTLMIRREPGLTPVQLTLAQRGCKAAPAAALTKDEVADLTHLCR